MKNTTFRAIALLALVVMAMLVIKPVVAQPPKASASAKTAQAVLAKAEAEAAAKRRPILLLFGASWCGLCTRLEAFIHSPQMEPIFATYYVIIEMDVMERGGNREKETPGGTALMDKYTNYMHSFPPVGHESLPYYVVLDSQGKKVADSDYPDNFTSIGYPLSAEELNMFSMLLKKTAPQMTQAQQAKIIAAIPTFRP